MWVNVGDGSNFSIAGALKNIDFPAGARLKKIKYDQEWRNGYAGGGGYFNVLMMKFEWSTNE